MLYHEKTYTVWINTLLLNITFHFFIDFFRILLVVIQINICLRATKFVSNATKPTTGTIIILGRSITLNSRKMRGG